MDLDIIQDCYQTNRMLLTELNRFEATSIVYCGFTMLPGAYCTFQVDEEGNLTDNIIEIFASTLECIEQIRGGESPELLKEYLARGNFWSDVAGNIGLEHGNGQLVKDWGFKAAIVGAW